MSLQKKPVSLRTLSREEIIGRIRDGVLAARGDVAGIVIFGSFAREHEWHDVDVLVVLRARIPTRSAWTEIANQLLNSIDLLELDLVPTWLEGLRRGLAAHRPLLMEIAFDGLVIYDQAAITDLLREAQREITETGIRRTATGWRFPVKYRQPSPLSSESNDTRARRWLFDAQRDLEVAEGLQEKGYFDRSVYHSQQSIERSVKAVLICFGIFERVHRVGKMLLLEIPKHEVPNWGHRLEQLAEKSVALEPAATDARYIDDEGDKVYLPWERYLEPHAVEAIEAARHCLAIAREFVEWWFAPQQESPAESPGDTLD